MKVDAIYDAISLVFVYTLCARRIYAESRVETNWTIVSQADGAIEVSWSNPLIEPSDENGQPSVLNVDQYTLSWSFINGRNETINSNITTNLKSAKISNAYLAATYSLILYCQMEEAVVTCKNQTITAYPLCPSNWKQKDTNCYYFNKEAKTWSDGKRVCADIKSGKTLTKEISNDELKQMIANNSNIWTVMDPCVQLSQEDVSRSNCCSSIADPSRPFKACPADTMLPFICQVDVEVKMVKPTNVSIASYSSNNSVVVSWDEINDGWNVLWRTLTVYNESGNLLSKTITYSGDKQISLPPLEPGHMYNLKMWPHKDGRLQQTEELSFALLKPRSASETNGGVLQLPLSVDATINWDGLIRVRWKPAMAKKVNTPPFAADGYRLAYGLKNDNRSKLIEINVTSDDYYYDITEFHTNQTYRINVACIFGLHVLVRCGKINQLSIKMPSKIVYNENKFKIYDVFNESVPNKTWTEAENSCLQYNGHLTSINNINDDNEISSMLLQDKQYWIGANNCNSNNGVKWSDGSSFNYNKLQNDKTPNNSVCCAYIAYDQNLLWKWDYGHCNSTLPYICQSIITDMGILHNLSILSSNSTTFQVQWKTSNRLVPVTSYTAEACEINTTVCNVMVRNVTSSPIHLRSLEPNTHYIVRVNATMSGQSFITSANVTATTGNKREVFVNVTNDGQVHLEWPIINTDNSENIVYAVTSENSTEFLFKTKSSNNTRLTITGLPYGETFHLKLLMIENGTNNVLESISFNVTTKPNCTLDEFQFESYCYWVWKEEVTWDEGTKICAKNGGQKALTSTPDKINFFGKIAEWVDSPLWLEGQTTAALTKSEETFVLIEPKRHKRAAECRIILNTGKYEDRVTVDQCVKHYPVLCERKLKVKLSPLSDLTIKDVTTTSITLQWQVISWKPSNYDVNVSLMTPNNRSKRETTTSQPAVTIGNDMATIDNLQPNTEYKVDITPTFIPNKMVGETQTITVQTLDPNLSQAPQALQMTGGQMDAANVAHSLYSNSTGITEGNAARNDKLWVFRIISCSVLIGLVTISILIFTFSGMLKYRDCVCEVCFEISLLVAHILILVDIHTFNQIDCRVTAVCIHYFFTTCFFFFALECFCHVKTMTKIIPIGFLSHGWQYFLIGWGLPIIIVIVTSTTVGDLYVLREIDHYCWLNMEGDAMLGTVIPIGIFAGLAFLSISSAICARPDENYEVDEESFTRYEPMQDLRWMLLFIAGLLVSHWAVGIVGTDDQDGNLYITFIVLNIVLGVAILLLRCIGDDEIRVKVRTCCKASSVEPADKERNRYHSSQLDLKNKKGYFQSAGPESDGTLIMRRTYIYRP